jgi:hypothetical protein
MSTARHRFTLNPQPYTLNLAPYSLRPEAGKAELNGFGQTQGGVPREQKMRKGHLPRVIYHQVY